MTLEVDTSRDETTGVLMPHYRLRRSAAVTTAPNAARCSSGERAVVAVDPASGFADPAEIEAQLRLLV